MLSNVPTSQAKLPLEIGVAYPKDDNETTVRELLHGIGHSENYHMMAMKFGDFTFGNPATPAPGTIRVYTCRYKKSGSEYCKKRDKLTKRDEVIMEAGPTLFISAADLSAAGDTCGALKALIGAEAKKAGEDWADHFYVGTMAQDLLRADLDDEPVQGTSFCTIPGLRNVEVVSPWIGNEAELSDAELGAPVANHDIDTESELRVLSEFMLNQRPVKVIVILDTEGDDEEEEEEEEGEDDE